MARTRRGTVALLVGVLILTAVAVMERRPIAALGGALVDYVSARSPHARYSAGLRAQDAAARWPGVLRLLSAVGVDVAHADDREAWLRAAAQALADAQAADPPITARGRFDRPAGVAAWRFPARRGHRIVVTADFTGGTAFVDLYAGATQARVASAPAGRTALTFDARADGDLVLRIQPALGASGEYQLTQRSEPSMTFPVQGLSPRAVHSGFGAQRDAGRRSHEGIDVFAPRGTPVVAATDGWVGAMTTNGLGGTVVWLWNPLTGIRTYYAHLDRRLVTAGERVDAGTVIGAVGNTGNARGGPTHLHFGVYAAGSGSVDPLPFVCGAPCMRGDRRRPVATGAH